jgi:hypothetical protein
VLFRVVESSSTDDDDDKRGPTDRSRASVAGLCGDSKDGDPGQQRAGGSHASLHPTTVASRGGLRSDRILGATLLQLPLPNSERRGPNARDE